MRKPMAIAAVAMAAALTAPAAEATTLRLFAESRVGIFGDWFIDFDDLDNDGLFSRDELTSFSGMSAVFAGSTFFFDEVRRFTPVAGISDSTDEVINFRDNAAFATIGLSASQFDLSIFDPSDGEAPIGAVPLPAGFGPFALALAGAALLGRRRARRG